MAFVTCAERDAARCREIHRLERIEHHGAGAHERHVLAQDACDEPCELGGILRSARCHVDSSLGSPSASVPTAFWWTLEGRSGFRVTTSASREQQPSPARSEPLDESFSRPAALLREQQEDLGRAEGPQRVCKVLTRELCADTARGAELGCE